VTAPVGCSACFVGAPAEVWARIGTLTVEETLVEESHFSVRSLRCGGCGQLYAKTFCERIDWQGGNDPQQWVVIPVSADEWEALRLGRWEDRALAVLTARECLEAMFPSQGPDEIRWCGLPLSLMPHD
jgi:hypothetical protein